MAWATTVKLTGWDELEHKLKALGPKVARRIGIKAVREATAPIIETAKQKVPVDTGALEDSIRAATLRADGRGEVTVLIGFKKEASWRAHFIEYGTVKMAAQPFMRPALDERAGDAIAIMGEVLGEGIEREASKKGIG